MAEWAECVVAVDPSVVLISSAVDVLQLTREWVFPTGPRLPPAAAAATPRPLLDEAVEAVESRLVDLVLEVEEEPLLAVAPPLPPRALWPALARPLGAEPQPKRLQKFCPALVEKRQ